MIQFLRWYNMSVAKKEESYIISVSAGAGCYRHIKISSRATLFELHEAIIDAFEFMDDHAHAFFMDNIAWSDEKSYFSDMIEEEERFTTDYTLDKVGINEDKKFKYIFDFGDEWIFQCRVLKILNKKMGSPEIIRSKGNPPSQYKYDIEDEEQEDDE